MKKERKVVVIKAKTQGSRIYNSDKKMVPVDMRSNTSELDILEEDVVSLGKITSITEAKITTSTTTMENKNEDREEGEIVDDYEDIISSDEELKMRKRIEELEATNLELEKIENISGVYGYDGSFVNHHERYTNLPEYKTDNLEYWSKMNSSHSTGPVILPLSSSGTSKHHKAIKSSTVSTVSTVKRLSPISVETTAYNRRDDNYYLYHHHSRMYKRRKSLSPEKVSPENDSTLQGSYHTCANKNKKRKCKISKARNKKKGKKLETIDISSSSDEEGVSILNREKLKRAINKDDLETFTKIRDTVLQRNSTNENIEKNRVTNVINLTDNEDPPKTENTVINAKHVNNLKIKEFPKNKQNTSSDDSVTLEEQELRMIALKSAIVKKHLARKKKKEMDARKPYSPSDQLMLESFKSPVRNSIDSDCSMDISPITSPETTIKKNSMRKSKMINNDQQNRKPYSPSDRLSLENSKNTSPLDSIDSGPMDISPIESPEFLSDSYNKPIDMDIVNSSESSTPTPIMNSSILMGHDHVDSVNWLPIEQVPPSHCNSNPSIILSPKPIKYSLTSDIRSHHLRVNSFLGKEKETERVQIATVSNSPEDSNDEEELALRALLLSKLNSPKVTVKKNEEVCTKQEKEEFQIESHNNIEFDSLEEINSPNLNKSMLNSDQEGSLDAEILGNVFSLTKEKKSFSKTELVLKEAVRRLRNKSQMSVNSPSEITAKTPEIPNSSNEQFSERDNIISIVEDNSKNCPKITNLENCSVGSQYMNQNTSNSFSQPLLNQLPLQPSNMNIENYKRDQKINSFLSDNSCVMISNLSSPILIQNQIENTPIPEKIPNFINYEKQRNNLITIPLVATVNVPTADGDNQHSSKAEITKVNDVASSEKTILNKEQAIDFEKKVTKNALQKSKTTKHKIIKKSIEISQQTPSQNTQSKASTLSSNNINLSLNENVPSKTDLNATTSISSTMLSSSLPTLYPITVARNFIPSSMTKTITNNEIITTTSSGSIINIPIVKRMIINLKESDSDSDSDEDFPPPTSSAGTFLSKDYEFNDNASPTSIQLDSPRYSPSLIPTGGCTLSVNNVQATVDICQNQKIMADSNQEIKNLEKTNTIASKSIVNDVFKARLDEYLKNVRSKVDSTKVSNSLTPANSTEISEKSSISPLAVCHLPPSAQLEYRKLINRMKILEKQKQIRNSNEVNKISDVENLKVTIENENNTNSRKTERSIICRKKTATPMIVSLQKNKINDKAVEFLSKSSANEICSKKDDIPNLLNGKIENVNSLPQLNKENANEKIVPLENKNQLMEKIDSNENNLPKESQDKDLENSYNSNSTKLLNNFSEAIDLIRKAKEKKLIKFELQLKQEKLKMEMKKIEKEIESEGGAISRIISKISKMQKTIVGQKKKNIDLEKLMKQKNYKIPQDVAREEIVTRNKEFSELIQEYKNLKSNAFFKANEDKRFCTSSCICATLNVPNDESNKNEKEKISDSSTSNKLLLDETFYSVEKMEENNPKTEELNLLKNNNFISNNTTVEETENMIAVDSSNTADTIKDNTKKIQDCENLHSIQKNGIENRNLDGHNLPEMNPKCRSQMEETEGLNGNEIPNKEEANEMPIVEVCSLTVKDDTAIANNPTEFKLKEYVSPLGQTILSRSIKPFGIVCPYQLRGQCDDKDCKYEHLFNDA